MEDALTWRYIAVGDIGIGDGKARRPLGEQALRERRSSPFRISACSNSMKISGGMHASLRFTQQGLNQPANNVHYRVDENWWKSRDIFRFLV